MSGMFDWIKEKIDEFLKDNMEEVKKIDFVRRL